MKTLRTYSSKETQKFGERIAKRLALSARRKNVATIFALFGELGSGKTTFVQGFLHGLGVKERSPSPTFIIFRRFALRDLRFANLYHIDAYRIKNPRELLALGFREILADPKNLVLLEWADRVKSVLPKNTLWMYFRHGKKEGERTILR